MRNEADVKKRVKDILNELGIWWYMPVQTGYGVKGVPDFIGCYGGLFVAIETKFGSNKTSKWQDIQIKRIRESDGTCFVINETNVESLMNMLLEARTK